MEDHSDAVLRPGSRSFGELFSDLTRDLGLLVRQEIQLAKVEMSQKASRAAKDLVAMGAGFALACAGALSMTAALVLGLIRLGVTPWVAALLIGAILAMAGFGLVQRARTDLGRAGMTPHQTTQSMKKNVRWVKEQVT